MKLLSALLFATLFVSCVGAEETQSNPFQLSFDYNKVRSAKIRQPHKFHHDKFGFSEGRFLALYTHPVTDAWGLRLGIGAMKTDMHWKGHEPFTKRHFNNVLASVGGYTKSIEQWVWDFNVSFQVNAQHASSRYTFIRSLFHGRYTWTKKVGLHVGLLGTTGMRYSTLLPVIGLDYMRSKWQFNLIFPINISAFYFLTDNCSAGVALRSFSSRQRMLKENRLSRGLVLYKNMGLEFGFNYKLGQTLIANIHIGETLGGRVRVSDQHDNHRKHYRLRPSPYFGLDVQLSF